MIVVTSIIIGLAAGLTRSALSIASAAVLIGVTFAAAAVMTFSTASFLDLGLAIAGYNLGLIGFVAIGAIQAIRSAPTH